MPSDNEAIAKHLALLTEAGLVTPEPGERRRVRYRLRSAPMQVAQQFLAALARDWDGPLAALKKSAGGKSMSNQSFTTAFTVDQSPRAVFDAANDVRGWNPRGHLASIPGEAAVAR